MFAAFRRAYSFYSFAKRANKEKEFVKVVEVLSIKVNVKVK